MKGFLIPKSNLVILALIGVTAISLAAISYQYSQTMASQIEGVATDDIRSNTEIQAHDLSKILINKVQAVNNNLRVVSDSTVFADANQIETSKVVLSATQDTTADLTDFYMWLDRDGKLVWLSDITPELYEQYLQVDLSGRSYFTDARDSGSIFYSTAIESNDGIQRMYISSPIIVGGEFQGVIAAGISLEVLGSYIQSQISPRFEGSVGMLDRDGIILYSDDVDAIGTGVFSDAFQSRLPADLKEPFNSFLTRSLSGGSGADDLSFEGNSGTLAYETVSIEGRDLGVLYVVAQHTHTDDVLSLIDQQRNLSTVIILVVGALAVGMALLILSWNKQLHATIKARTKELESSNESLSTAMAELKNHDRLQTEFINIAAHELRTPIQPLLGAAEILEEELENGVQNMNISKAEIEMMIRNAKRLGRLSSDLLEVSRIESNTLKLQKESLDLNEKIERVIVDTRFFIEDNKRIELVFQPLSNVPIVVSADKSRLFEVLSNLIMNSIKFTSEGTVTITSDEKDGKAIVSVKDTGSGIDPEIMPRLFTRFATKSDSGTGLGLFIAKNIVEAHGGTIWAENNPDGIGATFTFMLPLAAQQEMEHLPAKGDKSTL